MSNDGSRVFFMSPVALTPGAVDDVRLGETEHGEVLFAENVYEWEVEGVGSCPVGRGEGCVFLISDGRDTGRAPAAGVRRIFRLCVWRGRTRKARTCSSRRRIRLCRRIRIRSLISMTRGSANLKRGTRVCRVRLV